MFLPSTYWLDFSPVNLKQGETHIWYISLEASQEELIFFQKILSSKEKEKAMRFHFEKHRKYFTIAHAVMRILLGSYLHKKTNDIKFTHGEHGKPFLEGLYFNISHSHNKALLAVNFEHEIGVDIEFMRENIAWENIATRYFSQHEIAELSQVSNAQKKIAFFRGWTRKEAYIKATGKGLTTPLSAFYVPLWETTNLSICHNTSQNWGLWHLDVGNDYAGAVVLKTSHLNLRKYTDE